MMNDDIMVLDAYNTVYVWIGNMSNKFEKKNSVNTAAKYIENVKDERDKSEVNIVEVEAGKEPPSFTVQFSDLRRDKALI
jgi:gelsolin